jgi:hypothetical protein
VQSSNSAAILNHRVEILSENNRRNNNVRTSHRSRTRDRLDNDLSGSDSEKNYPDLIEMSALGASTYLRSEAKQNPYYFYTLPRRKDGDSRSPLLNSRRNSSGGDSVSFIDKTYDKNWHRCTGRRSNSFLDLSTGGGNWRRRNPSLPASPSRDQPSIPSATPLLDLTGLRVYSRTGHNIDDYDFRASQLEKFLDEYRTLREQLLKMKETRENLQRTRAVENEEMRAAFKGKPSVAVTQTSSAALADAASPLALSPPDYKPQQSMPEWLTTLLYRN